MAFGHVRNLYLKKGETELPDNPQDRVYEVIIENSLRCV